MPKWISAIFVFFLSTMLLNAKAITVEDVITKHVAVMAEQSANSAKTAELFLLSDLHAKGSIKLEGIENVNGRPCYKLSAVHANGSEINYLIDAKTWYLIKKTSILKASIAEKQPAGSNKNEQRLRPKVPEKSFTNSCKPAGE